MRRFRKMLQLLALSVICVSLPFGSSFPSALDDVPGDSPIPTLYPDADRFDGALKTAIAARGELLQVTGVIVPHHLLAIDVIAQVFHSIRSNLYQTIFVVFPDHFSVSGAPASTTLRSFETAFGLVATDRTLARALIDDNLVAGVPQLFEGDHGIHAILPFIAKVFPHARVVPVALGIDMKNDEVQALIERLKPLVTPKTLVVLSCDFSHFLPFEQALKRDQETLNLLAAKDLDALDALVQPDHIDSRAGLRLQTALQMHLGADLLVVENKNSQEYTDLRIARTTSYIGAVFSRALARTQSYRRPPADLCFGGDFFTGRKLQSVVNDPNSQRRIIEGVQDAIGTCPLVVNFEGVLTRKPVVGAPALTLWAETDATLGLLARLGAVAVSLANNHSKDLGESAYMAMASSLRRAGLRVIEHGNITDLGKVRVLGLTEVSKRRGEPYAAIAQSDFAALRQGALEPPILGFVHWGRQFEVTPRESQLELTDKLRSLGVAGIIGTHPHQASHGLLALNGGATLVAYSLGNFLFDQLDEQTSGGVLELYLFEQGTFFARQVKIPNLYKSSQPEREMSDPFPSSDSPPGVPMRRRQPPSPLGKMARTSWTFERD